MHLERSFGTNPKIPLEKYDALKDKFASFYFNGYGVKKHLKKLRKVIELEPHKKGYRQYTELLNQKLTQLELEEQTTKYRIKPYQQSLKPASLHKLRKIQNFFEDGKPKEQNNTLQSDTFKRQSTLLRNLPKISKSNQNISRNTELPLQSSSVEKLEKDVKSISTAEKLNKSLFKGKKLSVNKDRSEKVFNLNKSTLYKKPEITIEDQLKEVKHDEFVNFLKKRQEELLGANKTLKSRIKSQSIEEDIIS